MTNDSKCKQQLTIRRAHGRIGKQNAAAAVHKLHLTEVLGSVTMIQRLILFSVTSRRDTKKLRENNSVVREESKAHACLRSLTTPATRLTNRKARSSQQRREIPRGIITNHKEVLQFPFEGGNRLRWRRFQYLGTHHSFILLRRHRAAPRRRSSRWAFQVLLLSREVWAFSATWHEIEVVFIRRYR